MRSYEREEHTNWVAAMKSLRFAIAACPHEWTDPRTSINDIPREAFGKFEDDLRDWAFSYVRQFDLSER